MGAWNLYFIAKLVLYFRHNIGFHLILNLAFALFLLLPLRPAWLRVTRQIVALPLAAALLYYDSWLPAFGRLLSQIPSLSAFTPGYLVELLGRFVNPWALAALAVAALVYVLVRDRVRVATFVVIGMLAAPLVPGTLQGAASGARAVSAPGTAGEALAPVRLEAALKAFYQQQAGLNAEFPGAPASGTPFDILVIHVCSLAWDDLAVAGQKDAALLKRFDVLFDDFNSAASYSGPAAIRLLRAGCGQSSHDALYRPADNGCYLFGRLQSAGFEPALLMNHDGKFGKFIDDVRDRGEMTAPAPGSLGAAAHMKSFDGSPVYEDFDLLSRWLDARKLSGQARVAMFYSTVSLHDGNVVEWSKSRSSLDTYAPRLKRLLEDIDRFIARMEAEGGRAVVVFVPEHGANLRGDVLQIPGMREIPGPGIAHIPVGVRLVGLSAAPEGAPHVVSAPSSYLALATLIARFIERNPYDNRKPDWGWYLEGLPQTDFVAENEHTVVTRHGGRYYIRMPDGSWNDFQ